MIRKLVDNLILSGQTINRLLIDRRKGDGKRAKIEEASVANEKEQEENKN